MKNYLFVICYLARILCSGQVYEIYKDDKRFTEVLNLDKKTSSNPFIQDLHDSLPDGDYILYNVNKSKMDVKHPNQYLYLKATYKNNKREGLFECYMTSSKILNSILLTSSNYKEGKLHGSSFQFSPNGEKEQGFYNGGRLNGFYFSFNTDGTPKKVYLFENDTAKSWTTYSKGRVYSNGAYHVGPNTKEYLIFNEKEIVQYKIMIQNDSLKRIVEYYSNGNTKWRKEGVFKVANVDIDFPIEVLIKTELVTGNTIFYDEHGKIVKTEK